MAEEAFVVEVENDRILGILHRAAIERGPCVVIVVGGPQYRAGSHRQFVQLARALADAGHCAIRFDYRGMGDSSGEARNFEAVDGDVRAIVNYAERSLPGCSGVVLLGLCDAASAALMYCAQDSRVRGVVIMNPWVRTQQTEAQAYVRHYYGRRLLQWSFWRKALAGELQVWHSLRDLLAKWRNASAKPVAGEALDFRRRMRSGLTGTKARVLLLQSGIDLTAREFDEFCQGSEQWREAIGHPRVMRVDLPDADHTFSARSDLERANRTIIEWLKHAL
jgi:uncharacterized protein